jgi:hypothetical protein
MLWGGGDDTPDDFDELPPVRPNTTCTARRRSRLDCLHGVAINVSFV